MGNINTLFSTNPTEILPVEAYLADAQCFAIENLGSTRFMKVAKGKNSIDTYVYKVFVRQDNASLDPFPTKVKTIWETLSKAPNCSPIKLLVVKAKYAVLMRWYQKYTLSDRMSTRPFLGPSEKVWYIYQILKALEQCHREGVCHGDLKSQNVLVTSSNWCLITDFAPFKPSFLPLENPSSYTYFFDTSRRQTCYIAPERLLKTEEYDKNCENKDWLFGSLDPKMDMFSAGCVIYELLCDGKSPFTYSQLCQYKTVSKREAADILDRLVLDVPSMYRPLLKQLLLIEPQYRLTAEEALNGTAIIFPKIITEFLFDYMTSFLPVYGSSNARDFSQPLECSYRESDPVIQMLKQGKSAWMAKLQENSESKSFAVIFVSLITANVRCLKSSRVKVDAMNMLVELSKLCESHVAIDRILPYLVYSFTECEPQVQAAAIFSITDMLESTTPTTLEESLVFTDYLFPELTHLMETADLSQPLQFAIASCLGALAETAISYLTVGVGIQQNTDDDDFSVAETIPDSQKMTEKTALIQKFVHNIFTSLFGKFAIVRHCLVKKENLKRLTAFFYKCGNGDEVMSQLMTFLNEKKDWQMRAALFDSLPICAQRHNVGMEELLVQGLQDTEEFVVIRTIQCIAVLAANSILNKNTIKEKLLAEVIPFLAHPVSVHSVSIVDTLTPFLNLIHDVFSNMTEDFH